MRKIACINYKGGAGKTTLVVNLADTLVRLHQQKVLIIDTDPQGSVGHLLGITPKKTIYDVLIENEPVEACIESARPGLDILGANERLFPVEIAMSQIKKKEYVFLDRFSTLSAYDYVFLDCAPSFNILNQNALIYTNEVMIPVPMEYLGLYGLRQLLYNVDVIGRMLDKDIRVSYIVPTFYQQRRRKTKTIMESLNRVFPQKITNPIHLQSAVSECSGFGQTLFEYAPFSVSNADFKRIAESVYGRLV